MTLIYLTLSVFGFSIAYILYWTNKQIRLLKQDITDYKLEIYQLEKDVNEVRITEKALIEQYFKREKDAVLQD